MENVRQASISDERSRYSLAALRVSLGTATEQRCSRVGSTRGSGRVENFIKGTTAVYWYSKEQLNNNKTKIPMLKIYVQKLLSF